MGLMSSDKEGVGYPKYAVYTSLKDNCYKSAKYPKSHCTFALDIFTVLTVVHAVYYVGFRSVGKIRC